MSVSKRKQGKGRRRAKSIIKLLPVFGIYFVQKGNAFELWPLFSRQMKRQTFAVRYGDDMESDMVFVEVRILSALSVLLRTLMWCMASNACHQSGYKNGTGIFSW